VQLGQTALDPRNDPGKVARSLARTGIFNCVSCYKCEEVCPAAIPIVTQVIEPLKAKAALLVPGVVKHAQVLRAVVAERGIVDPTALVLRVRGLKAVRDWQRAIRLLVRGKIDPIKTLFRRNTSARAAAARLLRKDRS
jgi:fumarate reductase (CoM/CoB) subunit B